MKKLFTIVLVALLFGSPSEVHEATQQVETYQTAKTLQEYVEEKVKEHGLDYEIVEKVIACESSFNPTAVGDGGKSHGLVQIHQDYHPEVTNTQAYDPEFAVDFLLNALKAGKGNMWTCYRKLTKREKNDVQKNLYSMR